MSVGHDKNPPNNIESKNSDIVQVRGQKVYIVFVQCLHCIVWWRCVICVGSHIVYGEA